MTDAQGARFSARNRLAGTIARVTPGAVNTEVVLDLTGGGSVAAIITNESARALELAEGRTATAMFKASSVIVGVPA
jgi:molybdate transport system regulatory protein